MSKILITGGAGFIGTHLIKSVQTSNCDEIVVLDNFSPQVHGTFPVQPEFIDSSKVKYYHGSVTDHFALDRALSGVDVVVHLASDTGTGQSMYEIHRYNDINVSGTALLLEMITRNHSSVKKFVLSSSRSVYGEGAYTCTNSHCSAKNIKVFPPTRNVSLLLKSSWDPICLKCNQPLRPIGTSEVDPTSPSSVYAATKLSQESLVEIICSANDIGYAIFRFQNVYGEFQSLNNPYTGILSIFANRIRLGYTLPIFEDGLESRDFVHVSDVASILLHYITSDKLLNSIINIGTGMPVSVLRISDLLVKLLQEDVPIEVTAQFRKGDIRHNFSDNTKFKSFYPDFTYLPLHEGLLSFVNWVKTQPIHKDSLDSANRELKERSLMLSNKS